MDSMELKIYILLDFLLKFLKDSGCSIYIFQRKKKQKKKGERRKKQREREEERQRERGRENLIFCLSFFLFPIVLAVVTGQEITSVLEINYLISLQNALLNTY